MYVVLLCTYCYTLYDVLSLSRIATVRHFFVNDDVHFGVFAINRISRVATF